MIKSMTGYGKAEAILEEGKLTVEIRSVNSKSADISVKSTLLPKDREIEVRKYLADTLQRGTIDLFLYWEPSSAEASKAINTTLARSYYSQIRDLASDLGLGGPEVLEPDTVMSLLLRLPDVFDSRKADIITESNWPLVKTAIEHAVARLDEFRSTEGEILRRDICSRVDRILDLSAEIESLESERVEAVRKKIGKALQDLSLKPDKERFEQEMVFYLEKLDINEERVRLRQHCSYFLETVEKDPCPGKKLGFIIQEMGREINTTGSKANHARIQKDVVLMKDELEKIREQSLNIL